MSQDQAVPKPKGKAGETKPTEAKPKVEVTKIYEDEINVKTVQEILGLKGDLRVKELARKGELPSAVKNERGFWRFSRKAVEAYAANRPARAARGRTDGRVMYKLPLNETEQQLVSKALEGTGLKLQRMNKPKAVVPASGVTTPGPEIKA